MGKSRKSAPGYKHVVANIASPGHPIQVHEERLVCGLCGCKGAQHRAIDGRCPKTRGWGIPSPFPKFTGSDEKIDRMLARYWSAKSVFRAGW